MLVSFSGIDGAGKSTQIESLHSRLSQAGLRIQRLAFWDDVAVLKRLRDLSRRTLLKGDSGIGAPNQPVDRRDKNVQTWYMNAFRYFLYFLDAAGLAIVARKAARAPADVVIFDRYLYDELANLPLRSRLTRSYVHLVLKFIPQPDVAYLLDADPLQARERKPEYPLEFVQRNRAAYLALNQMTASMTLIGARTTPEMEDDVLREILKKLSPQQRETVSAHCNQSGAGVEPDGQSLRFQECQRVSGL